MMFNTAMCGRLNIQGLRFVLLAFLLTLTPGAQGQTRTTDRPTTPQSTTNSSNPDSDASDYSRGAQDTGAERGPALSADRILAIFRDNPELAAAARKVIQARAEQQGVNPEAITDAVVSDRIRTDANLRGQITAQLIENGYVDAADPDLTREDEPAASDTISGNQTSVQNGNVRSGSMRGNRAKAPAEAQERETTKRQAPPYEGIPSLADLYTQNAPTDGKEERFGQRFFDSAFQSKMSNDIPTTADYVLGPGDGLNLELWGSVARRMSLVVDREGRISLPSAGTVMLAGKTLAEARQLVQRQLESEYKNVNSDLSLTRVRNVRVYVVGEVKSPGAYDISGLSTVINGIAAAGGVTRNGSLRHILHYRGKTLVGDIDTYDLLIKGIRTDIAKLEPGDTLMVPAVGPQVTVTGAVRRPAIYELRDEKNLQDVLKLTGGVLVAASLQDIRVERVEAHQRRTMLPVHVPAQSNSEALQQALAAFPVQDGDRVMIGAIAPYSNSSVFVKGHVINPGKFSYREGLQVRDVIRSYQDLLPEPANRAEIVRLEGPSLQPRVMEFDLAKALSGETPVALQPFDTIRVYGRYDYDAPQVTIWGEVLRPGTYPMSEGMGTADLVRMAGGFKRSAFLTLADLTSYSVANGEKVELEHRTVEIGKAVAGIEDYDVRLKPGDVLSIRQISGWTDIGASVRVSGEVLYPGTYGIADGERLSSVLRRAGGFRSGAYGKGAMLTRVQAREMEQKARESLMHRIESSTPQIKVTNGAEAAGFAAAFAQQQQQILKRLKEQPVLGRQVLHISGNISKWENTSDDIELRAGDELVVPKIPNFVLVQGQVNSPSAISFVPGKRASWYLQKAGGPTDYGNRKKAFVIRADGSVIGSSGSSGWWSGNSLSTVMQPGDAVIIPEKIISGSPGWKAAVDTAQIVSSIAIAARVATSF